MSRQNKLFKTHWKHRYSHGGELRKSKHGRGARPLSSKDPLHLVFKINRSSVKGGLRGFRSFGLLTYLLKKYSRRFHVHVEQYSIQNDHVHLLVRAGRRAHFQSFFKVLAGQFSQRLTGTHSRKHRGPAIWQYRPFSRVVRGYKSYRIVRNYIQLNEAEALGRAYSLTRTRGYSEEEMRELWTWKRKTESVKTPFLKITF
jgi:REP element-mobilizing transposase RayT